ncbi:hypothetical protein DPMN_156927 [Dreissena polymorpha]|uniref:Uncharacterized protein n=1 Tax=Dreissena polymorpha TaxID=45954 RepID=A0A9D4FPZ1_DREPO|nr:hypothetical protein DPMN_155223 [Dreissena polymorpha]KAH3801569.1 hypothetical protein DPMN_155224 [Dreissena polymorpha]KAH3803225.1 hypothetical protein DPMN_156927 [Dreissena polymorpha]
MISSRYCSLDRSALHMGGKGLTKPPSEDDKDPLPGQKTGLTDREFGFGSLKRLTLYRKLPGWQPPRI